MHYGPRTATVQVMAAISINHVSIHAQDLERSAAFYEQLFGMQRIHTPTFAFPVAWLRLGRQQLHLFVRTDARAPQFHHVGLNVDDFDAIYWRAGEQRLRDGSAFFSACTSCPTGPCDVPARPRRQPRRGRLARCAHARRRIRKHLIHLSATVHQTGDALRATLYLDRQVVATASDSALTKGQRHAHNRRHHD